MLTEMHLAFMRLQRIANYQTFLTHSVLPRKHSCGWRNTATIVCTRVITSICSATAHRYKGQQLRRQPLKPDIRIKTVPFICSRHLQNCMLYGRMTCYVNVYLKCCCSSVIL